MNLQRNPGLLRALGPAMATAVVVGTVIGSGVFKKPQEVSANLPFVGLAALAWILGGILALLGALAYAEVAVLYPQAGGNYVFLREAFGRLMGFLWGWVEFWIIRGASLAALATIFTESLHAVLRETFGVEAVDRWLGFWPLRALTVVVILGLAGINMLGVRWGGLLQLLITTIKVGSLVFIALLPFALVGLYFTGQTSLPQPHPEYLTPMWPSWSQLDLSKFGVAMLGVLWAYHGWQNIGPVAGEVKAPQRNIPRSLLAGVLIVIALYLGANLAYYLVIPQDEMVKMKEPESKPAGKPVERIVALGTSPVQLHVVDVPLPTPPETDKKELQGNPVDRTVAIGYSRRLLGAIGVGLAAAAVMFSVFGALNGSLLVGPRLLYAMGEDRLAPRFLGAVHERFRTPAAAIGVMAVWAALLVIGSAALVSFDIPSLALGQPRPGVTGPSGEPLLDLSMKLNLNLPKNRPIFDILTDFAIFGAVLFETAAVASIFVFRYRQPGADRPYKCWGYPVVPAIHVLVMGIVGLNTLISEKTMIVSLIGLGFIAVGGVVYLLIARRQARVAVSSAATAASSGYPPGGR